MLFVTIGTKLVPDALPGQNTPVASTTLQLILELACLATSLYLTLIPTFPVKISRPFGISHLISYTLVSLQLVFFFSGMQNFTFNIKSKLAIESYEEGQVTNIGTTLVFSGAIGATTYEDILKKFNQGGSGRIEITSPGGLIGESLEIANFVKSRSISVHVVDLCASACVVIAAASPNLTASTKAEFGFHQGTALLVSDNSLSKFTSLQATQVLIDALRSEGIPEEILDEAQSTTPDEMYIVTAKQMYDAGIVKSIGP
jgi:ATP-dependent protease ClpP protease subunit